MDITYTFAPGEQKEVKPIRQRVQAAGEIHRMLRRCALEPVAAFSDLEGVPYRLKSPRFIVVARRRE